MREQRYSVVLLEEFSPRFGRRQHLGFCFDTRAYVLIPEPVARASQMAVGDVRRARVLPTDDHRAVKFFAPWVEAPMKVDDEEIDGLGEAWLVCENGEWEWLEGERPDETVTSVRFLRAS